eukprot:PhF_6_TR3396/c0_g1_i1/m.4867/K17803/OMS1; methyltransferase OMS1, mitochondrial
MSNVAKYVAGGCLSLSVFAGTAYYVAIKFSAYQKFTVTDAERMSRFNTIAPEYDKKTRFQEFFLGISWRRRKLIQNHGLGDVLEVGAGTGRNVGLFDGTKARTVTMCDSSEGMVKEMTVKAKTSQKAKDSGIPYNFVQCDVSKLPFPNDSYDTVIDMFGLCSFSDPIQALREMNRVCKPEGHVVLMEHGKGTAQWLNEYLDKYAPGHALRWGCWWNRDIRRFLRLSGLEITEKSYKHWGTTHIYICKPIKEKTTNTLKS